MKILVCNDDGIFADGILQLASSLSQLGEVVVVAPDSERSATGHAITIHHPIRVKKVELPGLAVKAFSVSGTPADCVKIGIDVLTDGKVDLIFSGINRGPNLGTDVFYSGTVSAAIEGCILGYKAAAISNYNYDSIDFSLAGEVALDIAQKMLEHSLPPGTLLNINIPDASKEDIMGVKITRLGVRKYVANYVEREDPRGIPYYWLAGEAVDDDEQDTDIAAVSQKCISVTPIHYDLTKYTLMDYVAGWFNNKHQSFGKDLSCDC